MAGLPAPGAQVRILLVGHDGLRHGAQTLLLRIGRALQANHGVAVAFLLLNGGPMEAEYRTVAPTTVAAAPDQLDEFARGARSAGCSAALANSAASARAVSTLQRHGIDSVLLVHEMPRLLREKNLVESLRDGMAQARSVVFPAELVRDLCAEMGASTPGRVAILPQGIEFPEPTDRYATRASLHLPPGT